MTSTNISSTDAQNFYNVTLETCAGKYEDYTFPINTRKLIFILKLCFFFNLHFGEVKYFQKIQQFLDRNQNMRKTILKSPAKLLKDPDWSENFNLIKFLCRHLLSYLSNRIPSRYIFLRFIFINIISSFK